MGSESKGPQKSLIETIEERYKAGSGQLRNPEFTIARVVCTQVLIENKSTSGYGKRYRKEQDDEEQSDGGGEDNEDDDESDDEDDDVNRERERRRKNPRKNQEKNPPRYMYSYRMELVDESGGKITAVLRPGLHEAASEEDFQTGARVRLTGWCMRETISKQGKEILLVCPLLFFVRPDGWC